MKRSLSWLLLCAPTLAPISIGWAQESPDTSSGDEFPVVQTPLDEPPVGNAPGDLLDAQSSSSDAGGVIDLTPANVGSPVSGDAEDATVDEELRPTLGTDAQDDSATSETSMVVMGDPELDAPIRRLATIRLDTREHRVGAGDDAHVITTEFDDFATAIPVVQVLASDPARYPGCTVQRGGTTPAGLSAPPARYVPDDMQIVLKDASGRSYLDGTVPARVEMAEPDVAVELPSDPEETTVPAEVDPLDAEAADTGREARRAERRAQRQAERRAQRQAERRAARRGKATHLGQDGAWIRLKGRGFRQFGKIALPPAPALNLRSEVGTGTLDGVLAEPGSIALVWDPASTVSDLRGPALPEADQASALFACPGRGLAA